MTQHTFVDNSCVLNVYCIIVTITKKLLLYIICEEVAHIRYV